VARKSYPQENPRSHAGKVELRAGKCRPVKQAKWQGLFSGLLYFAGCGSELCFTLGKNMTPQ